MLTDMSGFKIRSRSGSITPSPTVRECRSCSSRTTLLNALTTVRTISNSGDLINDMSGTRTSRFTIISFSIEYQAIARRTVTEATHNSDLDADYRKMWVNLIIMKSICLKNFNLTCDSWEMLSSRSSTGKLDIYWASIERICLGYLTDICGIIWMCPGIKDRGCYTGVNHIYIRHTF